MALAPASLISICFYPMNIPIALALLFLLLYGIKILRYKYAWEEYAVYQAEKKDYGLPVSVVVAFRNEASNLESLLNSLKNQVYPSSMLEIILVNDHSKDGSEVVAGNFCKANPNFRLVQNSNAAGGKKSAVASGIAAASGELIITTDADCTMGVNWLATLAGFYLEKRPDMMIGLVDIHSGKQFFDKFQEAEFLSLVASGAGAAASLRPIYCNAACFAFRKSLFLSMNDPLQEKIVSGDDTLFMHRVKKIPGSSIRLLKSSDGMVTTKGASSWMDFLNQRRRWISKSRHYRDPDTIYTAFVVLLINLSLLGSGFALILGWNGWLFPSLFTAKLMVDYLFLRSFMKFCHKKLLLLDFIQYALLYPFFTTGIALSGIFFGFSWKGRSYKTGKKDKR